jgi:hypothetical protein
MKEVPLVNVVSTQFANQQFTSDVNQEVIEKLCKMTEQFTERIIDLKNQTKSKREGENCIRIYPS